MTGTDAAFAGSIPELYDLHLGPCIFEPFAEDIGDRFRGFEGAILETAAGTGRVTRVLAQAAPRATITATDLNQPMLDRAAQLVSAAGVVWRQADAQALPFADAAFDAVVCQFGVMFFPDKLAGYSEARRVLRPGGRFVFNVWDDLAANDFSRGLHEAVGGLFPDDPPGFLPRTPFGYHDQAEIRRALSEAGFAAVEIETVSRRTPTTAVDFAKGMCMGSPLRAEIEARRPGGLDAIAEAVGEALARTFGHGALMGKGQALVVTARL